MIPSQQIWLSEERESSFLSGLHLPGLLWRETSSVSTGAVSKLLVKSDRSLGTWSQTEFHAPGARGPWLQREAGGAV